MATLRPARQTTLLTGALALVGALFVLDDSPTLPGAYDNAPTTDDRCFEHDTVRNRRVEKPDPTADEQEIYVRFEQPLTSAQLQALRAKYPNELYFDDHDPNLGRLALIANDAFDDILIEFLDHDPPATCMQPVPEGADSIGLLDDFERLPQFDSTESWAPLYVKFRSRVPVEEQRRILSEDVKAVGFEGVPAYNDEWRVFVRTDRRAALRNAKGIKWVLPAELRFVDDADEARRMIALPGDYDNDGNGTVIGQWEVCHPALEPPKVHPDLAQRATVGLGDPVCAVPTEGQPGINPPRSNRHATQVAGIAIGSGAKSVADGGLAVQWRGVAPGAKLVSYSAIDMFDFGQEYLNAVSRGVRISTNSFGPSAGDFYTDPDPNPYPFRSAFYDTLASARDSGGWPAGPGASVLVVASAGNNGAATTTASDERYYWRTIRVRNSAKNVLTIGNVSTGPAQYEGLPAFDTGRGPTSDGRIKPDLVAPGTEGPDQSGQNTELGIHAPAYPESSSADAKFYASDRGTSFSTPFVAGSAALASTTFENGACARKPVSAELRAVLIQSAKDLVDATRDAQTPFARDSRRATAIAHREAAIASNAQYVSDSNPNLPTASNQALDTPPVDEDLVGPDYVFGFGLVQPVAADRLVEGGHFVSDSLEDGYVDYPILVRKPMLDNGMLKVTLVWDDPPYPLPRQPGSETILLQNDLDLILIDPEGRRHFPWRLDPDNPSKPATQALLEGDADPVEDAIRGDRRNTVEQISVVPDADDLNKIWRIRVVGYRLGLPPQSFTVASSIIRPTEACAPIASVRGSTLPGEPRGKLRTILFIVALVVLFMLLLWLTELVYNKYEPQGRDVALGMVLRAHAFLLVVAVILWKVAAGFIGGDG